MSEEEEMARPPAEEEAPVEPLTGQALEVQETLEKILEMSGLALEVRPGPAEKGVALRLGGDDRRMLKQRNAELLLALQFLLNRMARRAWPEVGRIRLTTNGDNKQRESQLIRLTRGAANQVAKTGRTKKLRPMNAYERRLVHLTIREYSGLTSSSDGDGAMKRVRISKVKNELAV
jgi:spoIIIJ-associated protein